MNDITRTSKTLVALLRAIQLDTCDRAADEIERLQRELAERPALLDGLSVQQWKEHAKAGWKLYAARAENEPSDALEATKAERDRWWNAAQDRTVENVKLRQLLALAYSAGHLYGDDGELQDNRLPPIDYYRDSVADIERKMNERGMERLRAELTKEEERTADPDPWCDDCRAWQCHCEHNTRETK